jgi:hypothetical protein
MSPYFPDLIHVEAIRRALWTGSGRAAVMVGAGMSLNAQPLRPGRPAMPTWAKLTEALIEHLHPPGMLSDERKKKLQAQAEVAGKSLRLAEEYVAAFGRPALDDLIQKAIPDDEFGPGELHRLLLDLPWVDVLTTNYDTLLERAASTALRRYSTVRTSEEIPYASRSRIVKLHGSFPSIRPFILTEEDFRKYPHRFAPFVNLAQQVVMENLLCLIGFSGDDPNFLSWSGWVRDHLGLYAPRIYLCGFQNLTDAERRILHDRNVIPVDFTPLFTNNFPPGGARHPIALEWFLRSLGNGRPYDPLEWPEPHRPPVEPLHLPALLPPPSSTPRQERFSPPS